MQLAEPRELLKKLISLHLTLTMTQYCIMQERHETFLQAKEKFP